MSKMISHGKDKEVSAKNIKFALVLAIIWAAILGGLWIAMRNASGEGGGFLNFVGRLHPLIVHIPIGILVVVGVIEIFGRGKKGETVRGSVPMLLWFSFLGGIGSTIIGYLLMRSEGIAGLAMPLHMWTGIAVVVFNLLALITKLAGKSGAYALSLFLAIAAVGAAGHYGGALVHGKNYLTENAPEPIKKVLEPIMFLGLGGVENDEIDGEETETEIALEQQVAYTAFVQPILKAKCSECHNEDKIKGKLRMDTHELLLAGAEGSDYPTVEPGDAENSEMIVRATLEPDDDDFMPPGENDPLTPEEIKILSWWIDTGASVDETVAELGHEDEILGALAVMDATRKGAEVEKIVWLPEWEILSDEERETRLADAHVAADQFNFSLMPISAEDNRLRVNVINASKEFGDEQLKTLEPIAEHILWLDIARSQITDEGMKMVNKMRNLERLHLEGTKITDSGIAEIEPLENLQYLNLYGTEITDALFTHLQGIPNLQKLFVWQTKINPATARSFERSVNLEVNTGIDLVAVAAAKVAAEKEAADKAVAEKAAADKVAADKKVADAKAAALKKASEDKKKVDAAKKVAEEKAKADAAAKMAAEKKAVEEKAKAAAKAIKDAADKAAAAKSSAEEKGTPPAAPAPKPEPTAAPKEQPKAQ